MLQVTGFRLQGTGYRLQGCASCTIPACFHFQNSTFPHFHIFTFPHLGTIAPADYKVSKAKPVRTTLHQSSAAVLTGFRTSIFPLHQKQGKFLQWLFTTAYNSGIL